MVAATANWDEVTLDDKLHELQTCSSVFPSDSAVFSYCLNGSVCRISTAPQDHIRIICDCSNLATQNHFYAGPQCATKITRKYRIQQGRNLDSLMQLVNTSFIEDVLGMNQWKNDVRSVGPLPL